ncbi:hypothetical protein V6N13_134092 [Hibiscus sabdariffa]|uniref:Uncharacterized protein n=2 Tax=Hibiscus sabdariffa TaxID=183260 RepID=A0ABR1ZG98_9ROSI
MEASIDAVEWILNYRFREKQHLENALTHSSCSESTSYERLEFVGDAALNLAFTNHVYLVYPNLDPGQLSSIRADNISTEKLASNKSQENDLVAHGGSMKAPKVLADIVEAVAAAVYVDVGSDLETLWKIFRGLLEPIVTLKDLQQQPQPVTLLFEICQKQGKQVDIRHRKKGEKTIASVYVDGELVASNISDQKDTAKRSAVRGALSKLSKSMALDVGSFEIDEPFEMEGAKQKLHELCNKRKWSRPIYELEKDEGPPHEKKFISAVLIPTNDGILYITGDEKFRVKEAENSAASYMIRALQESGYM